MLPSNIFVVKVKNPFSLATRSDEHCVVYTDLCFISSDIPHVRTLLAVNLLNLTHLSVFRQTDFMNCKQAFCWVPFFLPTFLYPHRKREIMFGFVFMCTQACVYVKSNEIENIWSYFFKKTRKLFPFGLHLIWSVSLFWYFEGGGLYLLLLSNS